MDVTETWLCPALHSSQGLLLTNHTEERQGGRERDRQTETEGGTEIEIEGKKEPI